MRGYSGDARSSDYGSHVLAMEEEVLKWCRV